MRTRPPKACYLSDPTADGLKGWMMIRSLKHLGALLAMSFLAWGTAHGQGKAPDVMVRDGVTEVLAEIKKKDRKSTRLNSSHMSESRMPSSA